MARFYHHMPLLALLIVALGTISFAGGCRLFNEGVTMQGQSPLKPGRASPDSVAIEMMWVRFPEGDPQLNEAAWLEIDETQIAPEVRRELAANGFRVGVISGNLPDAMARALDQNGTSSKENAKTVEGNGGEVQSLAHVAASLMDEPIVRGHVKQLRRRERWEIQASDVLPVMPVLEPTGTQLGGHPYSEAQALYALRVDPQNDRSVIFELTPELHYGAFRPRWTSEQGVMLQASMRDRKVYSGMQMNVRLAANEMLVLMNLPNSGSRLGEYFHTVDSSDGRQQKLILLRLAQVPPSDVFSGEE